jgi:hypothetical protein
VLVELLGERLVERRKCLVYALFVERRCLIQEAGAN